MQQQVLLAVFLFLTAGCASSSIQPMPARRTASDPIPVPKGPEDSVSSDPRSILASSAPASSRQSGSGRIRSKLPKGKPRSFASPSPIPASYPDIREMEDSACRSFGSIGRVSPIIASNEDGSSPKLLCDSTEDMSSPQRVHTSSLPTQFGTTLMGRRHRQSTRRHSRSVQLFTARRQQLVGQLSNDKLFLSSRNEDFRKTHVRHLLITQYGPFGEKFFDYHNLKQFDNQGHYLLSTDSSSGSDDDSISFRRIHSHRPKHGAAKSQAKGLTWNASLESAIADIEQRLRTTDLSKGEREALHQRQRHLHRQRRETGGDKAQDEDSYIKGRFEAEVEEICRQAVRIRQQKDLAKDHRSIQLADASILAAKKRCAESSPAYDASMSLEYSSDTPLVSVFQVLGPRDIDGVTELFSQQPKPHDLTIDLLRTLAKNIPGFSEKDYKEDISRLASMVPKSEDLMGINAQLFDRVYSHCLKPFFNKVFDNTGIPESLDLLRAIRGLCHLRPKDRPKMFLNTGSAASLDDIRAMSRFKPMPMALAASYEKTPKSIHKQHFLEGTAPYDPSLVQQYVLAHHVWAKIYLDFLKVLQMGRSRIIQHSLGKVGRSQAVPNPFVRLLLVKDVFVLWNCFAGLENQLARVVDPLLPDDIRFEAAVDIAEQLIRNFDPHFRVSALFSALREDLGPKDFAELHIASRILKPKEASIARGLEGTVIASWEVIAQTAYNVFSSFAKLLHSGALSMTAIVDAFQQGPVYLATMYEPFLHVTIDNPEAAIHPIYRYACILDELTKTPLRSSEPSKHVSSEVAAFLSAINRLFSFVRPEELLPLLEDIGAASMTYVPHLFARPEIPRVEPPKTNAQLLSIRKAAKGLKEAEEMQADILPVTGSAGQKRDKLALRAIQQLKQGFPDKASSSSS